MAMPSPITPQLATPAPPFRMKGAIPVSETSKLEAELGPQFGFSRGKLRPDTNNEAARANILGSRSSFGIADYAPEPSGPSTAIRDPEADHLEALPPEDRSRPSWVDFAGQNAENDRTRQLNAVNISRQEQKEALLAQQIAQAEAEQQRWQELQDYGSNDPKIVQHQKELDYKASFAQGFKEDIAEMRQQHLDEMQFATTQPQIDALNARFDREYKNRLARYTADLGKSIPGQYFREEKPGPIDYTAQGPARE